MELDYTSDNKWLYKGTSVPGYTRLLTFIGLGPELLYNIESRKPPTSEKQIKLLRQISPRWRLRSKSFFWEIRSSFLFLLFKVGYVSNSISWNRNEKKKLFSWRRKKRSSQMDPLFDKYSQQMSLGKSNALQNSLVEFSDYWL